MSDMQEIENMKVAPYTGAWIEIKDERKNIQKAMVAPYTGAWIEIGNTAAISRYSLSRTLHGCVDWNWLKSLKYPLSAVAPYTGAWIEITIKYRKKRFKNVAPYTGAWIEIGLEPSLIAKQIVAPYTGAWIEIKGMLNSIYGMTGRTLHGCVDWNIHSTRQIPEQSSRTLHGCVDWNINGYNKMVINKQSHPTRVRGLKYVLIIS